MFEVRPDLNARMLNVAHAACSGALAFWFAMAVSPDANALGALVLSLGALAWLFFGYLRFGIGYPHNILDLILSLLLSAFWPVVLWRVALIRFRLSKI
jgi:hypothetical protein